MNEPRRCDGCGEPTKSIQGRCGGAVCVKALESAEKSVPYTPTNELPPELFCKCENGKPCFDSRISILKWHQEELTKATAEAVRQNERVIQWLLSDDTGVSSKSICSFMLGLHSESHFGSPLDSADRGRCIRLLNLVPEWWDRLDEMAKLPLREVTAFTKNGIEVRKEGWAEQIPLIRAEALTHPQTKDAR